MTTFSTISSTSPILRKYKRNSISHTFGSAIYSILQKLLNYPWNIKPKESKKLVMSRFADVYFLVKWLQLIITPNCDIWDSIAIVVVLDSLHNDFKTTTNSILKSGDKSIDEIQWILAFAKAKFLSKRTTGVTGDLAMMSKERNSGHNKRKVISKDRYINCQKLGYWGKDYKFPNQYQSKKIKLEDVPKNQQQSTCNCAHIAVTNNNDSDSKSFCFSIANMMVSMQPLRDV